MIVVDNGESSPQGSDNFQSIHQEEFDDEGDKINLVRGSPVIQLHAVDSNESSSTLQKTMDSQLEFLKNARKEAREKIVRESVRGPDVEDVDPQAIIDEYQAMMSDQKG